MQDRLLCRAKALTSGKWIRGHLIPPTAHHEKNSDSYRLGWKIRYIDYKGIEGGREVTTYATKMIKIDTLCQSTTKKIGDRLVWEKDILKVEIRDEDAYVLGVVFWCEDCLQWLIKLQPSDFFPRELSLTLLLSIAGEEGRVEIIGNAIDNPELLDCEEDLEN